MSSQDPTLLLKNALSTPSSTIQLLQISSDAPTPLTPQSGEQVFQLPQATHIAIPLSAASSRFAVLPKNTPSRVLIDLNNTKETYDLQALLFAYLNKDELPGAYMRSTGEAGTIPIRLTEKRAVVEWLSGKGELPSERLQPLEDAQGGDATGDKRSAPSDERDAASAAAGAPAQKKQKYQTNKADLEAVKRLTDIVEGPTYGTGSGNDLRAEKVGGAIKNRETVLRGDRLNNFESARALVAPRILLARQEAGSKEAASAAAANTAPVKPQKKKVPVPIIIVSPSPSALVNMHNVKQFLEYSTFEKLNTAQGGQHRGRAEDVVAIEHTRVTSSGVEGRKQRFLVVDSVESLSKFGGLEEAWDRVVCVMTTGQEWQFKPYKWQEPKELFHHVKGIYLQWTTDAPNPKVRSWNVTELRIDPSKRHIDKSTVADFWRHLDGWMAMHRPNLLL